MGHTAYNQDMNKKTSLSKHANKRTSEQVERDRELTVQMVNKGFTYQEISDYIFDSFGYRISARQVGSDMAVVRKRWLESQMDEYRLLVRQELARLDSFEGELWEAWRASKGTITQKRVEEVAKRVRYEMEGDVEDDDLVKMMVDKVITTTNESVGDRSFLELIFKTQQERRKLLGVYAPARLDIDVRETLNIKGYGRDANPDVWPDHEPTVIEGEFRDARS